MANALNDQEHLRVLTEFLEALDDYNRLTLLLVPMHPNTDSEGASQLERARARFRSARRTLKRWPGKYPAFE